MLDPAVIQALKDVGVGLAIGGTQVYNTWRHNQNRKRIADAEAVANGNFDALREDFDALQGATERLAVRIYGERRSTPRSAMTPEQVDAANAEAKLRRKGEGIYGRSG